MAKSRRPDLIWAHLHEGAYIAEPVARAYQIPLWMDRQGSLVEELASHGTLKKESRVGQWMFDKELDLEDRVDSVLVNTNGAYKQLEIRLEDRVQAPAQRSKDQEEIIFFPDNIIFFEISIGQDRDSCRCGKK